MMKAYKLLRTKKSKPGKLFPLYVYADEEVEIGRWLHAKDGPITKTGKVKSRLGELSFRPGWHLSEVPYAPHIGIKENGVIKYMHDDEVWCECEYSDLIDYQKEADEMGLRDGRVIERNACLDHIPKCGFYRYKTSPRMYGRWIIAGSMMVNRVLGDDEVEQICRQNGLESMKHRAPFDYSVFMKK